MEEEREDEDNTVPFKRARTPSPSASRAMNDGAVGGSGGVSGGMSSLTASGNERVPPRRK